jgi:hypothetical protein
MPANHLDPTIRANDGIVVVTLPETGVGPRLIEAVDALDVPRHRDRFETAHDGTERQRYGSRIHARKRQYMHVVRMTMNVSIAIEGTRLGSSWSVA